MDALSDATRRAAPSLKRHGRPANLILFFIHSTFETHPKDESSRVIPTLRKTLAMLQVLHADAVFVGCTTSPSSTPDVDPVATVALAHVPSARLLRSVRLPDDGAALDWGQTKWHEKLGLAPESAMSAWMLLLRAPSAPAPAAAALLAGLDFAYPSLRKLGAEAGRTNPLHEARLFDADGVVEDGQAVALVVDSSDVAVDVIVAQAARPVGPMLEVTEVRDGTEIARVREVGTPGQAVAAPMTLLDMWGSVDTIDREEVDAARKYLLFGTEVASVADMASLALGGMRRRAQRDGMEGENGKGGNEEGKKSGEDEKLAAPDAVEMLTRKVLGFNAMSGALAVEGDAVSLGARAQFQIRDGEAARKELDAALGRLRLEAGNRSAEGLGLMGALAFVDVERGEALYGKGLPDLDRVMMQERFGVPVATLTSGRQIGPLPAGGLRGEVGRAYALEASAVFVAVYGRVGSEVEMDEDGRVLGSEGVKEEEDELEGEGEGEEKAE